MSIFAQDHRAQRILGAFWTKILGGLATDSGVSGYKRNMQRDCDPDDPLTRLETGSTVNLKFLNLYFNFQL